MIGPIDLDILDEELLVLEKISDRQALLEALWRLEQLEVES